MKKMIGLFCIWLSVFPFTLAAQDRGLSLLVKDLGPNNTAGRQYLLLIAVDKYQSWPPLKNPVRDARELKEILTSKYYIDETIELYDAAATKANIIKTFTGLKAKLKLHDSLLVYYAGHGHLDKNTNSGFWIPVNAGTDQFEQSNWLPNTQIRGLVSNLETIHLLIVSDSCFSGDLLNSNRGLSDTINVDYFKKAYARISRQILTSGASESVPDESEFSRMLKLALKKNASPYFDPLMLFGEIRLGVHGSMPMFGNLKDTGHQEGASFLLFLKGAKTAEAAGPENEKDDSVKRGGVTTPAPIRTETKPPAATLDENIIFADEFDGLTLDPRWHWKRENRSTWSLSEKKGSLKIVADNGELKGKTNNNQNILLTDIEKEDFQMETFVSGKWERGYQRGGLIIYQDDDNYIMLTISYDIKARRKLVCFDYEQDGVWKSITARSIGDEIGNLLRLVKKGNAFSAQYSFTGNKYSLLFDKFYFDFNKKLQGGIFAFNGSPLAPTTNAYFDFFKLNVLK